MSKHKPGPCSTSYYVFWWCCFVRSPFFSKTCLFFRYSLNSFVSWKPNKGLVCESRSIRDWIGRVILLCQDIRFRDDDKEPLNTVSALIIPSKESNADTNNRGATGIKGAHFLLCPHKEILGKFHFSYSESSMENFISQNIMSLNQH